MHRQPKTYFSLADIGDDPSSENFTIYQDISEKISDTEYPCVGAKAALNSQQIRLGLYGSMASDETTKQLGQDLKRYISETIAAESEYMTMIAVFQDEEPTTEKDFETRLWLQLQQLHDSDTNEHPWDPEVSSNPDNPEFSFSYDGTAFFVVGLHPNASRKARQFGYTAMAFNLHRQFEQLREKGVYDNMKKVIRERDEAYDGTINPMLSDFGEGLEAPQYSGRQVDNSWKCPFLAGKL